MSLFDSPPVSNCEQPVDTYGPSLTLFELFSWLQILQHNCAVVDAPWAYLVPLDHSTTDSRQTGRSEEADYAVAPSAYKVLQIRDNSPLYKIQSNCSLKRDRFISDKSP